MSSEREIYYAIEMSNPENMKGYLSVLPLDIGQTMEFNEHQYDVKSVELVTFEYFPRVNKLIIAKGDYRINQKKRVDNFINGIGLVDLTMFMRCFFKKPRYHNNLAIVKLYYNSFVEHSVFV